MWVGLCCACSEGFQWRDTGATLQHCGTTSKMYPGTVHLWEEACRVAELLLLFKTQSATDNDTCYTCVKTEKGVLSVRLINQHNYLNLSTENWKWGWCVPEQTRGAPTASTVILISSFVPSVQPPLTLDGWLAIGVFFQAGSSSLRILALLLVCLDELWTCNAQLVFPPCIIPSLHHTSC